jgi:hypothetical protein
MPSCSASACVWPSPAEGVPVTLVVSVVDPAEAAPVFQEIRQSLRALGTVTSDIRTAARLRPRA